LSSPTPRNAILVPHEAAVSAEFVNLKSLRTAIGCGLSTRALLRCHEPGLNDPLLPSRLRNAWEAPWILTP
jgi:DNA polymerase III epsilon subunit-like protein